MKFNVCGITESDSSITKDNITKDNSDVNDLNTTVVPDSEQLASIYDKVCPISGKVFSAMKEAAANPHNVKLVAMKESGENIYSIYVEAAEFINFAEAAELHISEAADTLIDTCRTDCPEIHNAEFHVVFPSDALNKNILGGENLGAATKNDWAMELMRGCRRYGLKTNIGTKELDDLNNTLNLIQKESVFDDVIDKAIEKAEEAQEKIKIMDAAKAYRDKIIEDYNNRKKAEKEEKYKEIEKDDKKI